MIKQIDTIYAKMNNTPLSFILPMLYPIALECKDYEGYCILSLWGKPSSKEISTNRVLYDEMCRVLQQEGVEKEQAETIAKDAFEQYLIIRTIEKDQIMVYSARELEDTMRALDDMIAAVEVPKELHPVDLYNRSKAVTSQKLQVIQNRQLLEKQYAMLQSYIASKLGQYRRCAVLKQRQEKLEANIRNSKDVFIIHGHNEAKLLELEKMLKEEFGLNPIILKDQANQGLTIIDKFEKYAFTCSYAFALFTPDDIVTSNNGEQYFQARPNVIFELGWFYANLGRSKVCILEQASEKSEIFSDLQGIMRIQFKDDIKESYIQIRRELESAGIL